MSLLAPLYVIGAFAIGAPILFHLIRRQPKGQVPFSSLMFLKPTPPRLTRRSRLDNWLLLLLRALALILMAIAFARPFLRSDALSTAEVPGRRFVLVIDQSASMKRDGIWEQVKQQADEFLSDFQTADELAVVLFDNQPRTILSFDEAAKLNSDQLQARLKNLLQTNQPTWLHGDLGGALAFAGDLAVSHEAESKSIQPDNAANSGKEVVVEAASSASHLVLISDMAAGSKLDRLQAYAWPKKLRVDVRRVIAAERTNAFARILESPPEPGQDVSRLRVRVSNSADATRTDFTLGWTGDAQTDGTASEGDDLKLSAEFPVQVPPGQSRVIRMPAPGPGITTLLLRGDRQEFDNRHYVVTVEPQPARLIHLGSIVGEPRDNLLFYLQRIPFNNPRRVVTVETVEPDQFSGVPDPDEVPLVVVTEELATTTAKQVKTYCESGGRVLIVLSPMRDADGPQSATDEQGSGVVSDDGEMIPLGATVNLISDSDLEFSEAGIADYAMFGRIDFSNPLFQSMADPQFNDFSKIRFWAHRSISGVGKDWNVAAEYDDGDPAVLEKSIGKGRLFVLASGWQPTESQLALSTKFLPLMFRFFDASASEKSSQLFTLGRQFDFEPSGAANILTPSGNSLDYEQSSDGNLDEGPGVYRYQTSEDSVPFAVNMDPAESRTEPLDEEALAGFGVLLGEHVSTQQALENQRQLRDRELESQQRLWQWLLIAALALLGIETVLGTILSRGQKVGEAVMSEMG